MEVQVPDGDGESEVMTSESYFAKQIAVEPDYILSVNPTSVREDAGATDITVRVQVRQDENKEGDEVVQGYVCALATRHQSDGAQYTLPHRKPHDHD